MARFWIENGRLQAAELEPGSIEDSIAKWEVVVKHTSAISELGGCSTCALCQLYNVRFRDCKGCPVYELTHQRFCRGTPNEKYEYYRDPNSNHYRLKQIAEQELAMLIALRDGEIETALQYVEPVANLSGRNCSTNHALSEFSDQLQQTSGRTDLSISED